MRGSSVMSTLTRLLRVSLDPAWNGAKRERGELYGSRHLAGNQ